MTVPLVASPEATRVHPVSLSDGEITTVFVTGPAPFAPDLVVTGPDGSPLAANGVALGERGASISFQPSDPGAHSVRVSGFSAGQPEYDIELRDGTVFTVPEELAVGDCVDRFDDEPWAEVSGFLLVGCDQDHEGQVFEQVSGFDGSRQAADERCDEARSERIALPGPVTWWSYWGDDLTCIVVGGERRGAGPVAGVGLTASDPAPHDPSIADLEHTLTNEPPDQDQHFLVGQLGRDPADDDALGIGGEQGGQGRDRRPEGTRSRCRSR